MRMWAGINPMYLCRQHLLGEHKELHMLLGCMRREKSLKGYIDKDQVFPGAVFERHRQVVREMEVRGYSHNSPMDIHEILKVAEPYVEYAREVHGLVIPQEVFDRNFEDLKNRCPECRERIVRSVR